MYLDVELDTVIGDVLKADRRTVEIFNEFGMSCLGCSHSRYETIEDAAATHGVNAEELVAQLVEWFAEHEDEQY